MFCENCGKRIRDGAKSCYYCGTAAGAVPRSIKSDKSIGKRPLIIFLSIIAVFAVVFGSLNTAMEIRGRGFESGVFRNEYGETITATRSFLRNRIEFADGEIVEYYLINVSHSPGLRHIVDRNTEEIIGHHDNRSWHMNRGVRINNRAGIFTRVY